MRKLILTALFLWASAAQIACWAQCGLVGFATVSDLGLQGTTGGQGGKIVHVSTRADFEKYAAATEPYIIILDANLKGFYDYAATPKQKHDVISVASNKTIIGGGSGAQLDSLGLDINGAQNIIIRNLKITKADPDALAFRNAHHIWVDHCDLSSQEEENDANDGLLDFTYGSTYLTVSWCKFHDHNKSSICSSGTRNIADYGKQRVTYHHTAFINCTQRNPRIGYGLGHIFNDYNENNTSYAVGMFGRAVVNVENCYFKNVNEVFSQMYATSADDAYWGFVNETGCLFEGNTGTGNSTGFDVSRYYNYDFALSETAAVPNLVSQMGCVAGLESDIIPFPGDGAVGIQQGTCLACGDIEGAEGYTFTIGTTANNLQEYDAATYCLQPSTTYFWQVTVRGGQYDGTQSAVFRFTTADSNASYPTPDNGCQQAALREITSATEPCAPVTLRWREAFNAEHYTVYIDSTNLDNATPVDVSTAAYQPTNLRHGKTYLWRVDTQHADGTKTEGTVWTFRSEKRTATEGRNEVEHAVREGLCFPELDNNASWILASNDSCNVGDEGPGCMTFVWDGKDGIYDITTAYFDESSGQGWFGLYVGEEQKDAWTATANNNQMATRTTQRVALNSGDELRLEFYTNSKMRCRTDYIDIVWVDNPTGISQLSTHSEADRRIYSLDGRYLGTDKAALAPGIYIVGRQKIMVGK